MGSKERVREERRERMTEMMGELEINVKKKKNGFREYTDIRARERLALSGRCGWVCRERMTFGQ